jgi:hypothetical protein
MLKILALVFGLLMIAGGVLGFLHDFTPEGKLFGIFSVNLWYNIAHLVTGLIALICGLSSGGASRAFFILFGLLYGALAAYGYIYGEGPFFGFVNLAKVDNWLHTGIAAVFLYLGFFFKSR